MATIFNNISPDGENRRLMLIDAWAEDPLTVEMMDHPVNGDKVAVRSHNSLNEIVVDSVKVYDNGSWVDEGGGGGGGNALVTFTHVTNEGQTMVSATSSAMLEVDEKYFTLNYENPYDIMTTVSVPVGIYLGGMSGEDTGGMIIPAMDGLEVVSGDAEVVTLDYGDYFKISGNCTVKITWNYSD